VVGVTVEEGTDNERGEDRASPGGRYRLFQRGLTGGMAGQ
jgi:hypothetical protein